ncbi:MAG: hypothetical protein AAF738_09790 [Bacteroidota bacterium]
MKKEDEQMQAVTDLVALQVMTTLFLNQKSTDVAEDVTTTATETSQASHRSDNGASDTSAEHQSDEKMKRYEIGRLPFGWKLTRLWNFYRFWK